MKAWEKKVRDIFGSAAVDKKAAIENEIKGVPRYVSEFLLGNFCADGINDDSIEDMHEYMREHRIHEKEKEKGKYELQSKQVKQLIDKYKVTINLISKESKSNKLEIPSLGIDNAVALNSILNDHERLLIDGLWGLAQLEYDPINKQITMTKFKPFQLSNIAVEEYVEARQYFSTNEWINILISTVGLDYNQYSVREKLILLSRLVPMVEKNVFMMEFGLPGTGKTYAFEEISSYSRVISGSKITAPQLFHNLNTGQAGLLSQYDVILFDEIDKVKKGGLDEEVMSKLYQYLASGKFDRGGVEKNSSCGIMMVGNLPKSVVSQDKLLEGLLNEEMLRDAFLDRLNGVIPGWEIEPIKSREISLTKNWGLSADYFSEIMNELREYSFDDMFYSNIRILNISTRDEDAIRKVFSGMVKLIFPDGEISRDELKLIIDYSIELRQFVIDQIYYLYKEDDYNKQIEYELR